MNKKTIFSNFFLIFIIFLTFLIIIVPIFSPTIQGTADGFIHKFRLASFIKSLQEGNLRPRWLADQALGFGAPIFIYNYIIPYYAIAVINVFIHSIQKSTQVYEAFLVIAAFISMFILIKKLFGAKTAVITSIAYICAPYFLFSLYTYEALGETTSFLFPPLILYQAICLNEAFINQKKKLINRKLIMLQAILFVITWILFVNTHNVSTLESFIPLCILIISYTYRSVRNSIFIFNLIFSAFIISSFFWLPALLLSNWIKYKELIAYEVNARTQQYKSLINFISVSLNTLRTGNTNYYDFTIGILILLTLIVSLFALLIIFLTKQKKNFNTQIFFPFSLFLMTLTGLFLTTRFSHLLWDSGVLNLILYPYRFLFITTFAGTLLFAWLISKVNNIWLLMIFFIIIIVFARPYTNPNIDHFSFGEHYFENSVQPARYALWTYKNMGTVEFLPVWVDNNFVQKQQDIFSQTIKLPDKLEFDKSIGTILGQKVLSEQMFFHLSMKENADIVINTFYYPNWKATINKISTPVTFDKYGRLLIRVPKGDIQLSLIFGYSLAERVGFILSLLGLVYLIFILKII